MAVKFTKLFEMNHHLSLKWVIFQANSMILSHQLILSRSRSKITEVTALNDTRERKKIQYWTISIYWPLERNQSRKLANPTCVFRFGTCGWLKSEYIGTWEFKLWTSDAAVCHQLTKLMPLMQTTLESIRAAFKWNSVKGPTQQRVRRGKKYELLQKPLFSTIFYFFSV